MCNTLSSQFQTVFMKTPIHNLCCPHERANGKCERYRLHTVVSITKSDIWRIGDMKRILENHNGSAVIRDLRHNGYEPIVIL